MSQIRHLSPPARIAAFFLRTTPRIFPVPGWFPVVVERFHPAIAGGLEEIEVVRHRVRMRLDVSDYTQRRIFYDSHEPAELKFVQKFLRPGDVVLDVGAHVGIFSLVSASVVGKRGEVHAFEPVPANVAALERNVRLNGFDNVVANRTAVGADEGEVVLGLPDVAPDRGESSGMYTVAGRGRPVTAQVVTLDSYVDGSVGDRPIRLLKIDAEGSEPAVLAGLARRLASAPPSAILFEVNLESMRQQGFNLEDVLRPLRDARYRLYRWNGLGRLKLFEGARAHADLSRAVSEQPSGFWGWYRRYRAERQVFFNLLAVQAGE
jgi:FkbM family methyltransferase